MKLSDEKGRTRYGLVKYVLQNFCVNHKKGIMEAFLATIALFVAPLLYHLNQFTPVMNLF